MNVCNLVIAIIYKLEEWIHKMPQQRENKSNDNYAEKFENEDIVYVFIAHVQIFIVQGVFI